MIFQIVSCKTLHNREGIAVLKNILYNNLFLRAGTQKNYLFTYLCIQGGLHL